MRQSKSSKPPLRKRRGGVNRPHHRSVYTARALVRCALLEKIDRELQMNAPDLDSYPIPEAADGDEPIEALFDTSGDDFDQLTVYKIFQGRDAIVMVAIMVVMVMITDMVVEVSR